MPTPLSTSQCNAAFGERADPCRLTIRGFGPRPGQTARLSSAGRKRRGALPLVSSLDGLGCFRAAPSPIPAPGLAPGSPQAGPARPARKDLRETPRTPLRSVRICSSSHNSRKLESRCGGLGIGGRVSTSCALSEDINA